MSSDYKNPAFKKLLQRLQEESWQLELIISGFAIFGLITAIGPIKEAVSIAESKQQLVLTIILGIALVSCSILIFNLLLHVVLRGLWIGTLGLRYVSGDIDYDSLNYSEKFTKYLKKRVGSFDKYVATLENYCSIIFAVSFLLIFYVLALTFTIITIVLIIAKIIENDNLPETFRTVIGIILILFFLFGMVLTFIDFITQGWLKKKKWISKIYFPIYWVFSFITLSFLYRPLVYNFLDNKFGRRLSFVLLPVYLSILILTSFKYKPSNYFDGVNQSSEISASRLNYMDQLSDSEHIDEFAISSKVITTPYLNVFFELTDNVEDNIFNFKSDLKPVNDKRGLRSGIIFTDNNTNWSSIRNQQNKYLEALNQVYSVKIDSTDYDGEFILSENKHKDLGFETFVSIKDLEEGKHLLKVIRRRIKDGDTVKHSVCKIPFWHFKE
ncbi:hypothetical protein [Psychroserpens ponticola]|uniref:DUF4153 domain-containing protein n=1 Tax=Psychroserpens ponticola TaxID=2932268 RepID=A0ABY7RUH4_9FLAO|nr:hypothetical protein [Psychroserpens ponticola]WCO00762.1 hypothetical protein MUN68_011860 [Psychroserpens ponticola]